MKDTSGVLPLCASNTRTGSGYRSGSSWTHFTMVLGTFYLGTVKGDASLVSEVEVHTAKYQQRVSVRKLLQHAEALSGPLDRSMTSKRQAAICHGATHIVVMQQLNMQLARSRRLLATLPYTRRFLLQSIQA